MGLCGCVAISRVAIAERSFAVAGRREMAGERVAMMSGVELHERRVE